MVNALGIAGDLGADDAGGVGLLLGTANPADALAIDHLDVERAGRRAIVRTGGVADVNLGMLVHAPIGNIKFSRRREALSGPAPAKSTAVPCITRRDRPRHWRGSPAR